VEELVSMVAVFKLQAGTNGDAYRSRSVGFLAGTAQHALVGTRKLTVRPKTVPSSQIGKVLPRTSSPHGEGEWGSF